MDNMSDDEFYGFSAQQSMFMDGAWSFKLAPFHRNAPKIKYIFRHMSFNCIADKPDQPLGSILHIPIHRNWWHPTLMIVWAHVVLFPPLLLSKLT